MLPETRARRRQKEERSENKNIERSGWYNLNMMHYGRAAAAAGAAP